MTNLEEIQNSAKGSKEWIKFGSKMKDPFLSIFNEDIKKTISAIEYTPGKNYNFTDGDYEYKIDVEQINNEPKFTFYIRSKSTMPVKKVYKKQETKMPSLLIITIVIVLVEFLILLLLGVFQTAFW